MSKTTEPLAARPRCSAEELHARVAAIPDPEIPVLTIEDLGVLRSVTQENGRVVVTITPTYSGCPAMQHIEEQILDAVADLGSSCEVRTVFRPAWTSDWMREAGRRKLERYGIAPPQDVPSCEESLIPLGRLRRAVRCPRCGSHDTELESEFSSTACKALYQCQACREPFDYFKEL